MLRDSTPFLWVYIGHGLRKCPRVSGEVLRSVLALAVGLRRWFLRDLRAVICGSPAVGIYVFHSISDRVAPAHHFINFVWAHFSYDYRTPSHHVQLNAMTADAQSDGKSEGIT